MSNQSSPETSPLVDDLQEVVSNLSEEQKELLSFYESAQWLPDVTETMRQSRDEELEATDNLARESGHEQEIPMLRFIAAIQIENAKRLAGISEPKPQATEEPVVIGQAANPLPKKGDAILPGLRQERALGVLQRMGVVLVDGGRGSHQKIYYPETGVTTVMPVGHKGKDMSPKLLRAILGQLGIPADKFKTYIS